MENKKETKRTVFILTLISLLSFVTAISGAVFAYFSTGVTGDAQTNEINTAILAGIHFEAVSNPSIPSIGIVPGWIGIQTFTIEGQPDTPAEAKANYEVDLDFEIDPAFNDEITYEVYKTTTPSTHYVTNTEGTLHNNFVEIYRNDTLNHFGFTGVGDAIKSGSLQGTGSITLDSHTFQGQLEKTTYYLVYRFTNLNEEQHSQGKLFNTTVSANTIAVI